MEKPLSEDNLNVKVSLYETPQDLNRACIHFSLIIPLFLILSSLCHVCRGYIIASWCSYDVLHAILRMQECCLGIETLLIFLKGVVCGTLIPANEPARDCFDANEKNGNFLKLKSSNWCASHSSVQVMERFRLEKYSVLFRNEKNLFC